MENACCRCSTVRKRSAHGRAHPSNVQVRGWRLGSVCRPAPARCLVTSSRHHSAVYHGQLTSVFMTRPPDRPYIQYSTPQLQFRSPITERALYGSSKYSISASVNSISVASARKTQASDPRPRVTQTNVTHQSAPQSSPYLWSQPPAQ